MPVAPRPPLSPAAFAGLFEGRIAVLDGGMGSLIQGYELGEADFRGTQFRDHGHDLKGNNDLLCLTRPDIIEEIHRHYLEAGADLIETNTFSSTSIAQADYRLESVVADLNLTLSMSPDVNRPEFRAVTWSQVVDSYTEQVRALLQGGVDALLVETIFDTLNAKAAIFAIEEVFAERGQRVPVMISVTITDASGRTLSGQTPEAFYHSIRHANPFSVGINCALGGRAMRPYLEALSRIAECRVTCYPNAGLPNAFGGYDESPEEMATVLGEFARAGLVNLVGGCCGSTPDHIRAIAAAVRGVAPRTIPSLPRALRLSGLEPLTVTAPN